ncbi:MAG: methyltransferase domain-containing protein [Candidatus Omnitrophica bacterium]|nr:methyltransferase domain-containing protein [Candidatus Omnitrophota bacterium]MDE2232283.1 methyltransferase domain-containing protein [Candidatus Omnitrophota bacterium]
MVAEIKKQEKHNKRILQQFTRQAIPFSRKVPAHSNQAAFNLIIKAAGINKKDAVLDVACGPGMMSCAMAQKAKHVTGIDLVPKMLKQARLLRREGKLSNMDFKQGDVYSLPFADASFSAVVTRFSVHHFLRPLGVLKEMKRVAAPKGRVAVIDVFTKSRAHSRLHNLLEKLRDDSHVKALSLPQLKNMMRSAGLRLIKTAFYQLAIELESQLSASFPKPGCADRIRRLVHNDKPGLVSTGRGKDTFLVYPIVILVGEKS